MSLVSSPHAVLLEQVITAASMRHKVIANNIANVNTPGFKRSEVRFEEILHDAISTGQKKLPMSVTHAQHLLPVHQTKPLTPHTINETSMRTDGNNVDV